MLSSIWYWIVSILVLVAIRDVFFQKKHSFNNAKLTSFGMTKKTGRSADNDPGLSALLNSNTPAVCIVGKSWDFHVDIALGISNEENLEKVAYNYRVWEVVRICFYNLC